VPKRLSFSGTKLSMSKTSTSIFTDTARHLRASARSIKMRRLIKLKLPLSIKTIKAGQSLLTALMPESHASGSSKGVIIQLWSKRTITRTVCPSFLSHGWWQARVLGCLTVRWCHKIDRMHFLPYNFKTRPDLLKWATSTKASRQMTQQAWTLENCSQCTSQTAYRNEI